MAHSYTDGITDELGQTDNLIDLMSGNEWIEGTYPEPYDTAVINRYASGWIDPHEVYVMSGGGASFHLTTVDGAGYQMAVIDDGDSFYTLAARVPGPFDPFPVAWAGVEALRVDPCPYGGNGTDCYDDPAYAVGFRRISPEPSVSPDLLDDATYSQPLPHVIPVGGSRTVNGVNVKVIGKAQSGYRVSIGSNPTPIDNPTGPVFDDVDGHIFESDIEWLSEAGITRGRNPPANTLYCPNDPVTRGQMAAFLRQALGNS